ncbi:hypothetical protein GUITHDRAFT_115770 [Guillardia theta CCMP2712]|uniref:Uncharacterized protein n=1 Tax=Guillardia theta (strain CCMP2712) TaxID=905079 RepID=L1IP14_GUITC|nr:hypothetical protein GUITHDRAFT_115770 [Guillardia theta CCMP2712]EKX38008.1 hypothetical protein GUITHDRAFT_115770 [Guillardia theta CCMP2712]|eukprot:XP_005824988.1 hypothetical protein GUITHDRAFT_115770 [Guillardia theta CCMP2712]
MRVGVALLVAAAMAGIVGGSGRAELLEDGDRAAPASELQLDQAGREQALNGIAMGTHGGADGLHNIPTQRPTWERGGATWVYGSIYGDGIRPQDSVWCDCDSPEECKAKCGGKEEQVEAPESPPKGQEEVQGEPPQEEQQEQQEQPAETQAEEAPAAEPEAEEAVPARPRYRDEKPREKASRQRQQQQQEEKRMGGTGYVLTLPQEGYEPKLPVSGQPVAYPAQQTSGWSNTQAAPTWTSAQATFENSGLVPSRWTSEDAAEHTLNLQQWRISILRSKLKQARLRKELMKVATVPIDLGRQSLHSRPRSDSRGQGESQEIDSLKKDLVAVASETASARPFSSRALTLRSPATSSSSQAAQSKATSPSNKHLASRLQDVQKKTLSLLHALSNRVDAVVAERKRSERLKRSKMLSSIRSHLRKQASEGPALRHVNAAVERKREEEERAARRKSEVGEVQSALGNIQKSVESSSEAVREEGKRSKRKEEKILAVRDKADKELDSLLKTVDEAIARKKWREKMRDGA